MPGFEKIGETLERVGKDGAVLTEWERSLGPEYPILQPFLVGTKQKALTYPCPLRDEESDCPGMKVVGSLGYCQKVYSGEIMMVFDKTSEDYRVRCGNHGIMPLKPNDLHLYRFDMGKFWEAFAASEAGKETGIVFAPVLSFLGESLVEIGSYSDEKSRDFRVFFTARTSKIAVMNAAYALTANTDDAFVLLVFHKDFASKSLKAKLAIANPASCIVPLNDFLVYQGKEFVCADELSYAMEKSFREIRAQLDTLLGRDADATWATDDQKEVESKITLPTEAKSEPDPCDSSADKFVFQCTGDSWHICFRDKTFDMGHERGLFYIAYLLNRPQQVFRSQDIVQLSRILIKNTRTGKSIGVNDRHETSRLKDIGTLDTPDKKSSDNPGIRLVDNPFSYSISGKGDVKAAAIIAAWDNEIKKCEDRIKNDEKNLLDCRHKKEVAHENKDTKEEKKYEASEKKYTSKIEQTKAEIEDFKHKILDFTGLTSEKLNLFTEESDRAARSVAVAIERARKKIENFSLELANHIKMSFRIWKTATYLENISWDVNLDAPFDSKNTRK